LQLISTTRPVVSSASDLCTMTPPRSSAPAGRPGACSNLPLPRLHRRDEPPEKLISRPTVPAPDYDEIGHRRARRRLCVTSPCHFFSRLYTVRFRFDSGVVFSSFGRSLSNISLNVSPVSS